MKSTIKIAALVLVIMALAVGGGWYWQRASKQRNTENAYVNADIVQVASQLNGPVTKTYVHEGQSIEAGQPLFDLDDAPYRVALAQAQAKLAEAAQGDRQDATDVTANDAGVLQAQTELSNARIAATRTHSLVQQNFLAKQADDDAQAKVRMAEAAVAQAKAKLEGAKVHVARTGGDATPAVLAARAAVAQAELDLKHTHVVASKAGWVANFNLVPGTTVVADMPLFALVSRGSFWVDANFKETELPGIRPGQAAEVDIDMLPDHPFTGVVDIIGNGTGAAFSLLPAQNATGNWVKVTQRVPVRIRLTGGGDMSLLRVGASAQVTVKIAS